MIDWHGLLRNRSTAARSYPTCPATPVAMDIKEINSKVTVSNQLEFFIIDSLRDEPTRDARNWHVRARVTHYRRPRAASR